MYNFLFLNFVFIRTLHQMNNLLEFLFKMNQIIITNQRGRSKSEWISIWCFDFKVGWNGHSVFLNKKIEKKSPRIQWPILFSIHLYIHFTDIGERKKNERAYKQKKNQLPEGNYSFYTHGSYSWIHFQHDFIHITRLFEWKPFAEVETSIPLFCLSLFFFMDTVAVAAALTQKKTSIDIQLIKKVFEVLLAFTQYNIYI